MKRLHTASLAAVGTLLLTAGCTSTGPRQLTGAAAVPSPPGKEDCVFFRTMRDWSAVDRERLILHGMGKRTYLATLSIPSTELPFDYMLGFQDRDNDGRICGGFDSIITRDGIPDRITIASVKLIDEKDAKAFMDAVNPKRQKAKLLKDAPDNAPETTEAPAAR
jgi:hypothetical protein